MFVISYFNYRPLLSDTLCKLYVICIIGEFYTTLNFNSMLTFRDNLSVAVSRAKQWKKNSSWTVWTVDLIYMAAET